MNGDFVKVSQEIVRSNGLETVKRWSQDTNPAIAEIFKDALEAAGSRE